MEHFFLLFHKDELCFVPRTWLTKPLVVSLIFSSVLILDIMLATKSFTPKCSLEQMKFIVSSALCTSSSSISWRTWLTRSLAASSTPSFSTCLKTWLTNSLAPLSTLPSLTCS